MVSKKDLFFSVLIDVRERDGEYQAAIEYPAPRGKGSLCNGEIWCSTAMIDYSKNKLSHRKESPRREEL